MSIWEILGIDATNDINTIRKAYSEKIKEVHMEDDPDGFLKLKDAYKAAVKSASSKQTAVHIEQTRERQKTEEPTEKTPNKSADNLFDFSDDILSKKQEEEENEIPPTKNKNFDFSKKPNKKQKEEESEISPPQNKLFDFKETDKSETETSEELISRGFYYYEKSNYTKAFELWLRAADDLSSARAMCLVGNCYALGKGVDYDISNAFAWHEKAAEQGDIDALYLMGDYYRWGEEKQDNIVKKNHNKARDYFKKAATGGHAQAAKCLGFMYMVPDKIKDGSFIKSLEWFKKSAALGEDCNAVIEQQELILDIIYNSGGSADACALFEQGCLHSYKDEYEKAFKLIEKAAKQGHLGAKYKTAEYIILAKGCERDLEKAFNLMLPLARQDEVREVRFNSLKMIVYIFDNGYNPKEYYEEILKLYEIEFEKGGYSINFINNLAFMYSRGWGTEKDNKKTFELYQKAVELEPDNTLFLSNLGYSYNYGIGCKKDCKKAFAMYKKAALLGDALGQNNFGGAHEEGAGTEKDMDKAFYWYSKAAEQEHSRGMENLGRCYMKGKGCEKDYNKAFDLLMKTATKYNEKYALCLIGEMYQKGLGREKDLKKAFEYYQKSADFECSEAWVALGRMYLKGIYVKKNEPLAKEYFEKAVKEKNKKAKSALKKYFYP